MPCRWPPPLRCFPRATRGWKGDPAEVAGSVDVSPALRGDGRTPRRGKTAGPTFPPRYAGMEGGAPIVMPPASCFPRATRGWKETHSRWRPTPYVSPALRGDGRNRRRGQARHCQFPPRYAGMEGVSDPRNAGGHGFPRATRGWKGEGWQHEITDDVSPALRGDGRVAHDMGYQIHVFPPRYAGMEGEHLLTRASDLGFPRATRGWKEKARALGLKDAVSPALRGDGRTDRAYPLSYVWFPPRYAGMEDSNRQHDRSGHRFPRATRGWKGEPAFEAEVTHVSPALRGDGRASGATASTERGFPPRYAGMEGLPLSTALSAMCFPRATRGWKEPVAPVVLPYPVSHALRGDGRTR